MVQLLATRDCTLQEIANALGIGKPFAPAGVAR